jgi:hypothetical protein
MVQLFNSALLLIVLYKCFILSFFQLSFVGNDYKLAYIQLQEHAYEDIYANKCGIWFDSVELELILFFHIKLEACYWF